MTLADYRQIGHAKSIIEEKSNHLIDSLIQPLNGNISFKHFLLASRLDPCDIEFKYLFNIPYFIKISFHIQIHLKTCGNTMCHY